MVQGVSKEDFRWRPNLPRQPQSLGASEPYRSSFETHRTSRSGAPQDEGAGGGKGGRSVAPLYGQRTVGGIEERIESMLPPVLQAEDRAAVVEQVELDVAAAAHLLLVAVGLAPGRREVAPHDRRIDVRKASPTSRVKAKSAAGSPVQ